MASQTVQASPVKDSLELLDGGKSTDTTLSEALITLRKRRLVLVVCILLGIAYGIYQAFSQPRIYNAFAEIEVRSGSSAEYKIDPAQGLSADAGSKLGAEVVILQSDSLLLTVAREMNLCNNPDFLGAHGTVPYQSLENPFVRQQTLQRLHQQLKVALIPKTDIIRLTYSSLSAKLSADLLNKVVADYIQRSYETRYLSTQRVSQWLSGQLDDLKRQVETSQEQMLDIQRRLGMLGLDPAHNQNATTLEDLSVAAAQARIARILAESKYRVMQGIDPNTIEDSIDSSRGTGTPMVLTQLRSQIATARASLAQLQATLGPNHPQVKSQAAQVAELQKELSTEEGRLISQAKEDFVIAKSNQDQTLAALEEQKAQAYKMRDDMVEYTLRQREFESNRTLYEGLLQRLRTAGVEAGLESLEIDIVDPALPPAAPTMQPKSTIVLIMLVVGLLIGIVISFLLESLDTGLRSISEIESISQLPSLAVVPKTKRTSAEQNPKFTTAQRNIAVLTSPKSQFAESLRSLRTSLLLSTTGRPPKFILFTSSTPSEGKTTIASNMACVLAQGDNRVLLIDADLRRPNVHPRFGLSAKIGLSTLLTGGTTFTQSVQQIPESPNLDILASGPVPPFPAELLSSEAMKALLAECAQLYDYVVIDSPPILSVTDGVILARQCDAVALVVRQGTASKHIVRRARDLLIRAGAPITGIVLNAVDLNSPEYQGYYGQSGYHYAGVDSETWEPQHKDGQTPPATRG
ncbi:MAG TPA: polysaccharide biosynthesis tyrosine autokinase [Granulicella sp.]|jgi:succinoglycan biosynthesis transport protein ExoP|nr:polysaccharide biosynthesis tyrosine autokinase [Granulicella sp.]